jgi:hypothetical protein
MYAFVSFSAASLAAVEMLEAANGGPARTPTRKQERLFSGVIFLMNEITNL